MDVSALLDSGAQINLIRPSLSSLIPQSKKTIPPISFTGVQGHRTAITEICSFEAQLPCETKVQVECAITPSAPVDLLLGLPFLRSINATVDFKNNILRTFRGPIALVCRRPPKHSFIIDTPQSSGISVHSTLQDNTEKSSIVHSDSQQPHDYINHDSLPAAALKQLDEAIQLSPGEPQTVVNLLMEFKDLWKDERRGQTTTCSHMIELTTKRPLADRPRRYAPEQIEAISEIDKMLADGVIRPSRSEYASELVMVKKAGGAWRVCVDVRLLNRYTVLDRYPLPRIYDLLRAVKSSRYFAALDLRAGYWQIPMAPCSIK